MVFSLSHSRSSQIGAVSLADHVITDLLRHRFFLADYCGSKVAAGADSKLLTPRTENNIKNRHISQPLIWQFMAYIADATDKTVRFMTSIFKFSFSIKSGKPILGYFQHGRLIKTFAQYRHYAEKLLKNF